MCYTPLEKAGVGVGRMKLSKRKTKTCSAAPTPSDEGSRKKHRFLRRAQTAESIEVPGQPLSTAARVSKPQPSSRGVKKLTIAIDGPSGAGKSTVARSLARRLGYVYIDTGAMYRSLALRVKEKGISPENELALNPLALSLHIHFVTEREQIHVFCEGEDITEAIRTPEISRLASSISKQKGVREALVHMQREMGKEGGVVLEGRDIGTVVFPDADVKFYLDAESHERVRRRYDEMVENGVKIDFKETQEELLKRDYNDTHRIHSPLKKADDALFINSTHRSVEEVVEEMVRVIKERIKSFE
jgi:cytidylate kinase